MAPEKTKREIEANVSPPIDVPDGLGKEPEMVAVRAKESQAGEAQSEEMPPMGGIMALDFDRFAEKAEVRDPGRFQPLEVPLKQSAVRLIEQDENRPSDLVALRRSIATCAQRGRLR